MSVTYNTVNAKPWFYNITGTAEKAFKENYEKFLKYDSSGVSYIYNEITHKTYKGGILEHMTIKELKSKCNFKLKHKDITFKILLGEKANVGIMQSLKEYDKSVFLIASNFDALEHPNECTTPANSYFISNYINDHTQGPTASLCSPIACIERCCYSLNMLENYENVYTTKNGYPILNDNLTKDLTNHLNPDEYKTVIHNNVEISATVTKNEGFKIIDKPEQELNHVDQVFAAAVNIGQRITGANNKKIIYENGFYSLIRYPLLCGYISAYLTAIKNNRKKIVLTLLGGGVFKNKLIDIIEMLLTAHIMFCDYGDIEEIVLPLFKCSDHDMYYIKNELLKNKIKCVVEYS